MIYADKLVPRLGKVNMDARGKVHLEIPKVRKIIKTLDQTELSRCLFGPVRSSSKRAVISPMNSISDRLSAMKANEDVPGHAAAAVVQKLRRKLY